MYAPSSVEQGQGLLLECRVNHTVSVISRLFWEESSNKNFMCLYRFDVADGPVRCMNNRALSWWSGSSNYLYINRTQLSDSGHYTCTVKIGNGPLTVMTKEVVVYSEFILLQHNSTLHFLPESVSPSFVFMYGLLTCPVGLIGICVIQYIQKVINSMLK